MGENFKWPTTQKIENEKKGGTEGSIYANISQN